MVTMEHLARVTLELTQDGAGNKTCMNKCPRDVYTWIVLVITGSVRNETQQQSVFAEVNHIPELMVHTNYRW